jgi:hypothetical protein
VEGNGQETRGTRDQGRIRGCLLVEVGPLRMDGGFGSVLIDPE